VHKPKFIAIAWDDAPVIACRMLVFGGWQSTAIKLSIGAEGKGRQENKSGWDHVFRNSGCEPIAVGGRGYRMIVWY